MKKAASVLLCIAMILTFVPLTSFAVSGNTYYIDSVSGDDLSLGTSEAEAWKTTANIASLKLQAGDKILFKRAGIYECTLSLTCSGTAENPIVISAYGEGERPLLTTNERNAVLKLFDCDYVAVSDLEITGHNAGKHCLSRYAKLQGQNKRQFCRRSHLRQSRCCGQTLRKQALFRGRFYCNQL